MTRPRRGGAAGGDEDRDERRRRPAKRRALGRAGPGGSAPRAGNDAPRRRAAGTTVPEAVPPAGAPQPGARASGGGRRRAAASRPPGLTAEQLRWVCPDLLPSSTPPSAAQLLGQERPLAALRMGLQLYAPGYNIFVSGLMGSGRTTVVHNLLQELQPACRLGPDRVYVNNFQEPTRPRLLTLPRGTAQAFQEEMEDLVAAMQEALRAALRSRPHKASRKVLIRTVESRERRLMEALARQAAKEGFELVQFAGQGGTMTADIHPVVDGEAVSQEAFAALVAAGRISAEERERLLSRREDLVERLEEVIERARASQRKTEHDLRAMDRQVASRVLESHFRDFRRRWPQPEVAQYLETVRHHVERDLERWAATDEELEPPTPAAANAASVPAAHAGHAPMPVAAAGAEGSLDSPRPPRLLQGPQLELAVHVVKTGNGDACPIVVEDNPTYVNLFGTIEPPKTEAPSSSIHLLHPGALVKADGGYLVLRAADVLAEPGVWQHLQRALHAGKVEIREFDAAAGTTAGTMQPEAIPIDLKVVLIGEPGVYETLAAEDPQFLQTFKVHAEFDSSFPASLANLQRYADLVAWLQRNESLPPFAPDAAAAVAECGARLSGRRDRLSTRFGELADVAREAAHLCRRQGAPSVRRAHVERAVAERRHRHDLVREQVEREFADGYLLVQTSGREIGQVNALTVLDTGMFVFGKPCRITAASGAGTRERSGLVNIEREAQLSGPLHDKGVMILQGFLLERFAKHGPICLQATICLEQIYGGVDGDSASSAELYALLSSLSDVPIDQGLAVTGSVNQKGEVQAVSAINEKAEGFYRLCRARRLTGKQGIVLPRANVADLMLDTEVVEAVAAGRFHVHAVEHVFEGLELLTGVPATEVMRRAEATLRRFAGG